MKKLFNKKVQKLSWLISFATVTALGYNSVACLNFATVNTSKKIAHIATTNADPTADASLFFESGTNISGEISYSTSGTDLKITGFSSGLSVTDGTFKSTIEIPEVGTFNFVSIGGCLAADSIPEVRGILKFPSSVKTVDPATQLVAPISYLTNVTTLDFSETQIQTISKRFVGYCDNLTQLLLPETLKETNWSLVAYCPSLTELILPKSLTKINTYLFDYQYQKNENKVIKTNWTKEDFSTLSLGSNWSSGFSGEIQYPIIVPEGNFDDYWNNISNFNTSSDFVDGSNYIISANKFFTGDSISGFLKVHDDNGLHIDDASKVSGQNLIINDDIIVNYSNFNSYIIEEGSFQDNVNIISSLTLSSSVTSIGANAFNGCTGLTDITIKTPFSSSDLIGDNAFANCTNLKTLYVPTESLFPSPSLFVSEGLIHKIGINDDTSVAAINSLGPVFNNSTEITGDVSVEYAEYQINDSRVTTFGIFDGKNISGNNFVLHDQIYVIKESTFENNKNMYGNFYFDKNLEKIEKNAFNNTNITDFYFNTPLDSFEKEFKYDFDPLWLGNKNEPFTVIHVQKGTKQYYLDNAKEWGIDNCTIIEEGEGGITINTNVQLALGLGLGLGIPIAAGITGLTIYSLKKQKIKKQ